MTNKIMDARIPENKELKTLLITVPRTTIQIASTMIFFHQQAIAQTIKEQWVNIIMIITT